MKPIKKRYRLLCALLALCVLGTGVGVVVYHGEWWFPLLERMERHGALALTGVVYSGEARHWTYEELVATDGVTASNNLLLVNAEHPLPEGYLPTLEEYNGAKMHPLMIAPYVALRDDVQAKTGVRIYVASDYRTPEEQADILASAEDGIAAQLGCSEHEAGLALDVYAPYLAGINFLRSRAGRTVNRVCHEYGYVIRYPVDKEDVTGIEYEPWHLRYVGAPHAMLRQESGLTLEEYVEALSPSAWYVYGEYWISRRSADDLSLPTGWTTCEISPDNTGYYIVTLSFLA